MQIFGECSPPSQASAIGRSLGLGRTAMVHRSRMDLKPSRRVGLGQIAGEPMAFSEDGMDLMTRPLAKLWRCTRPKAGTQLGLALRQGLGSPPRIALGLDA